VHLVGFIIRKELCLDFTFCALCHLLHASISISHISGAVKCETSQCVVFKLIFVEHPQFMLSLRTKQIRFIRISKASNLWLIAFSFLTKNLTSVRRKHKAHGGHLATDTRLTGLYRYNGSSLGVTFL
jgi:hypothetical protein